MTKRTVIGAACAALIISAAPIGGGTGLDGFFQAPDAFAQAAARAARSLNQKPSDSEAEKPKTKKAQLLSKRAFDRLTEAQELTQAGDNAGASELLLEMLDSSRYSDYEHALVMQNLGYIYIDSERYKEALPILEQALALDILPDAVTVNIIYNLAQLYMMEERWEDAIRNLELWFEQAESPQPRNFALLATAYVQVRNYEQAVPLLRIAIERADKPREQWFQTLLAIYFEQSEFELATNVLQEALTYYPDKKSFWMQLAAVLGELGQLKESLAVQEVAYQNGMLTEGRELERLAQQYMYQEMPYKAAVVLEKGFEEGVVEKSTDNYELLANGYFNAREFAKAIPPLKTAASLSDDGELYIRLGQAYSTDEKWAEAAEAFDSAFEKGDLDDPGTAYLQLGVAHYNLDQYDAALDAFKEARRFDKSRKDANSWVRYVEATRNQRSG